MWLIDPKNNHKSVSLTLLIISFMVLVVVGLLDVFRVVESVGVFLELFLSTGALYFGRTMVFNNKKYGTEKAEKVKDKIEAN